MFQCESFKIDDCPGVVPELDECGNIAGAIPVDQFPSQPFMKAENGFPRSDISALMHAESEDLKAVIAARINEVKSQYPDQSLTDEQIAARVIPRYVQTQHELADWMAQHDIGVPLEKLASDFDQKKAESESIKFDETDVSHETE